MIGRRRGRSSVVRETRKGPSLVQVADEPRPDLWSDPALLRSEAPPFRAGRPRKLPQSGGVRGVSGAVQSVDGAASRECHRYSELLREFQEAPAGERTSENPKRLWVAPRFQLLGREEPVSALVGRVIKANTRQINAGTSAPDESPRVKVVRYACRPRSLGRNRQWRGPPAPTQGRGSEQWYLADNAA